VSARNLADEERSSNRPTHESELHSFPRPVRVHEHQPLSEARKHAAADEGDAPLAVEHQRPEEIGLQLTTVAPPAPAGDTSPKALGGEADRLAVVPVTRGAGGNPMTLTHQDDPRARPDIAGNSRHPSTREVGEPDYANGLRRDATRRGARQDRGRAQSKSKARNTSHELILCDVARSSDIRADGPREGSLLNYCEAKDPG
jgi:hypothetical protein